MLQWGGRVAEFALRRRGRAENGLFVPRPQERPGRGSHASLKGSIWQDHGRIARDPSHIRVIRSATAFGRNPGNVLIRVLDVAGFAMDAILRVYDELRRTALLNPFIDTSRAIARRRPGKNIVLGCL